MIMLDLVLAPSLVLHQISNSPTLRLVLGLYSLQVDPQNLELQILRMEQFSTRSLDREMSLIREHLSLDLVLSHSITIQLMLRSPLSKKDLVELFYLGYLQISGFQTIQAVVYSVLVTNLDITCDSIDIGCDSQDESDNSYTRQTSGLTETVLIQISDVAATAEEDLFVFESSGTITLSSAGETKVLRGFSQDSTVNITLSGIGAEAFARTTYQGSGSLRKLSGVRKELSGQSSWWCCTC